MNESWDEFLDGFEDSEEEEEVVELEDVVHDIFVQLDALRDERVERHDFTWRPPRSWGGDPANLERLVTERWQRGVLYLPPGRRAR